MTKLISGRIAKVHSANVSADRYQFIELSETEPDLGLPSQLGQVFTSDLSGNRYWVRLDTANVIETSGNLYFTNARVLNSLVGANVSLNNLIVSGDLEVQGNLVTLNVVSVSIEDKNLLLANGAVNAAAANGAGITIAGANAEIRYQNTEDKFDINKNVNIQGNLSIGGSIQAKDANSLLRNEINLDPNNGTYMSVWSEETTSFSSADWGSGSWNNESGLGAARFTDAQALRDFWLTGIGSIGLTIEASINGGARTLVFYEGNNGEQNGVELGVDAVPPGGQGTTIPITSLVFYYRTQSKINIDRDGGEILLDAQSMDIDLRTTENLDLRSSKNLNLRGLGSYPVRIYTNGTTHKWEFDTSGSLTLPREGKIYGIGDGGPGGDRYGYISWDGNSSGDGFGYNTMRLVPDQQGLEAADQYIIIDPTSGEPGHIHIRAGGVQDNSGANLFLGGENSYVQIGAGANPPVTVKANNNAWTFGTDGITSFPSQINVQGNVVIDGTFIGNGLIIRNIAVSDEILTGNILGQGFTSNTIIVSETLTGNVITANVINATVWNGIYTANVLELDNLYFTAQRAISALEGNNVTVNNLTVSGDLEVQGNLVSINTATLNVEDKNIVLANGATSSAQADGAGITISGANATLTYANTGDKFVSNKDLEVQGNLIVGSGGTSNVFGINQLSAKNIIADTNTANVINATVWNGIYTANVIESPTNLYYTNDRVYSFVTGMSIGDLVDVANIYTHNTNGLVGIQEGQALVWDGNIFIPVFVNSEVANIADLAVKVLNLENQSTANVREAASNLYFTNTRVLDAISLATISPSEIYSSNIITDSITANIWNRLFTANVIETSGNLYFTNARTVGVVTPLLTTANVIEISSNLYFTQQRARDSVSNSTGVYYNTVTGVFSIGQDVAITSDVQFRDLTLLGNLFILGNVAYIAANTLQINDPLIQVGVGNPGDQWDLGLVGHYLDSGQRHAGLFRDATDKKFKFFSNTIVEPGNVTYIDTSEDSFRLASVVAETFEGNVLGTVSSLENHTTSNLAEGTRLYYTNTRVVQAVTPLLTTANVLELTNQYFTNVRVLQVVDPKLTTANVTELNNLYYTNARVLANVEQMSINVLADVDITGVAVNATLVWDGTKFVPGSTDTSLRSNFANAATFANVSGSSNVALLADRANLVSSLSNHNTSNLAEGTNLYYTNSRVLSALVYANVLVADLTAAGNLVANGLIIRGINVNDTVLTGNINITNIAAANVINANIISAQQWQGIYTANVIESPTNLYFTNTRARTAFLPGKGIAISGDGVITNTGAPFEYNTGIDGSGYANVLSTMSNLVRFSGTSSRDRFLLRSLHITNVSGTDAAISGNVLYATGNTAFFANLLPVPVGGAVELMLNTQLFQPNDIVNLQGFTSTGVATSNLLQAIYTFETFSQDNTYQGTGQTLTASNTDILVYDSTSTFSIVESIKVVNLDNRIVPVRVYWADANNVIKAHLAFNTPIPPNSSFETISTPKRITTGDRIFARFNNAPNNAVSIFISARLGYNYAVSGIVSNVTPSGTASVSFSSSESDGTLLYYTIE